MIRRKLVLIGRNPQLVLIQSHSTYKGSSAGASTLAPKVAYNEKSNISSVRRRIPFKRAERGPFFQEKPSLGNVYEEDAPLQSYLARVLPSKVFREISPDLHRFGARVAKEIDALGHECERIPPQHQPFDAWGNRVDQLITCQAWKKQKDIVAQEGLVSIPYEREYGQWSRVYQIAKLLLYFPSSGMYSCPQTMTDGAASVLQCLSELSSHPDIAEAKARLLSRDPENFWSSGQWMTERKGGSDVANGTETVAVQQADGSYRLYGFKWFSSATDADITLALARIADEEGNVIQGSRGLSLFFLKMRNPDGSLNGVEIQKLKNKLGTKQLPTAELLLDGSSALLISEPGRGVAAISDMLNITRILNAVFAASYMRRVLLLARSYSLKRVAFGKTIIDHPLHMQTLSRMEVETRAANFLVLEVARLLGLQENNKQTTEDKLLLRILTPVLKIYTAKQAIQVCSEGLESFGGQGYIEDTGLPYLLRDVQVTSIWEGTSNVLSQDILRSLLKTQGQTLTAYFSSLKSKISLSLQHKNENVRTVARQIDQSSKDLRLFMGRCNSKGVNFMQVASRDIAYSLARVYMAALMLEQAAWEHATEIDVLAAVRWCEQDLCPVITNESKGHYEESNATLEKLMVMQGYPGW